MRLGDLFDCRDQGYRDNPGDDNSVPIPLGLLGASFTGGELNLKTGMERVETVQATQHQTNPIAPRWTFRVRTH
jgi:hypothetical protein